MAWVIIFIVFSLGIVLVGGFETVQAICTIAGFPLIFVALLLLHSIYQSVMTDPSVQRANLVAPANERREWMRQRLSEQ